MQSDDLKPIRTEADHERAMAEVERLWGSKIGTPDGNLLDALITLIEDCEKDIYPFDPPDPIEAIRFRREQLGHKSSA
jgi:HTH-type transcriptional regulator/antitoxin HigA